MNYNTFCHTIAAVNEVLQKQAYINMQKQAAGPGRLAKAWGAMKSTAMNPAGMIPGHPYLGTAALGAGGGAIAGGIYGGATDGWGGAAAGLGLGALGGAGLGAGAMGGYQHLLGGGGAGSPLLKYLVQNHPNVAQKAWYMNPMLGLGMGGAALGAGAGYLADGSLLGTGIGALAGAGLGAGAGYGGRRYANDLYGKRNWMLPG